MIALCKCGLDMTEHDIDDDGGYVVGCEFEAAGTKYPCEERVNGYLCPRPRYHEQEGVPHGPLTGEKLW